MADEVSDDSSRTCPVQDVAKDTNVPQPVSVVVVISDDDDEAEIVGSKLENTEELEAATLSDAPKPTRRSATVAVGEENRREDDGSPSDQTCSICLGGFDNKAFPDQCFHAFCFYCILQWSEVVHTCPLCKSSFSSIIHSVKSMEDYKQHFLPATVAEARGSAEENGRRFRYRTTLTHDQQQQRQPRQSAWEMRDHRRRAYQSAQKHRQNVAKEKRRTVYTNCLWVQRVSQQGKPKYRDISPGFFRINPACTHRLVPWLKRELGVLLNDSESHVQFIQQLVMTLINKVEIDSGEFPRQLRPFLAERTEHFVHEFHSFARSPFDMTAYDERAQYSWPGSNGRAEPEPETPTVFHGSSTGWETPAFPGGPSHSRWNPDSPPPQVNSTWSPGPSRATNSTSSIAVDAEVAGHRHSRIIQNVHLNVNIENGGDSGRRVNDLRRGPVGVGDSGTTTPRETTSPDEVQVILPAPKSRTRSRDFSSSRSRSLSRSPSQKRRSRAQLVSKHKSKKKHKHKRKHRRRENDEERPDREKRRPDSAKSRRKSRNVIVISSDTTASPDYIGGQHVSSSPEETLGSSHLAKSRAGSSSSGQTHSRSKFKTESPSTASPSSRSRCERSRSRTPGSERLCSRSRTDSRSPESSRARTSRHERTRSRTPRRERSRSRTPSSERLCSRSRTDSRSPESSRARMSRHERTRSRTPPRERSRSRSVSRADSHSPTSGRSQLSRHRKTRKRSRSKTRSKSKSRHGKTREAPENSRHKSRSPNSSGPHKLNREFCSDSRSKSANETRISHGSNSESPTRVSSVGGSVDCSSSVEDIEREIQELEARMREDKKRLLQLMMRQEERAMEVRAVEEARELASDPS